MDPKIAKKTQDTLGKHIKKPPLTEKLLSKPPFRFLHDVVTSVIKGTGVMDGLYTDSELNSENVKDRDSKIAFLQKAVDYVGAASGKSLGVKPAKVVAGHEPEKTNEFLQALASAINSKVDNSKIVDSVNNKGGKSSSKKEEKEEKPREREKSSDRRKRDEEKKSKDRDEGDRGKDRDEKRHRDRDDRHKDRDREDRHKDRDSKHHDRDEKKKDREERHRDRESEREQRHKSGRSRYDGEITPEGKGSYPETKSELNANVNLEEEDDNTNDLGNETFAVQNPKQVFNDSNTEKQGIQPIPRHASTYREIQREKDSDDDGEEMDTINVDDADDEDLDEDECDAIGRKSDGLGPDTGTDDKQSELEPLFDSSSTVGSGTSRSSRPKGARRRRVGSDSDTSKTVPSDEPSTPYVSEEHLPDKKQDDKVGNTAATDYEASTPNKKSRMADDKRDNSNKKNKQSRKSIYEKELLPKDKKRYGSYKGGPKTSTPKSSPLSPKKDGNNRSVDTDSALQKTPIYGDVYPADRKSFKHDPYTKSPKKRANSMDQTKKKLNETGKARHKSSISGNMKLKLRSEKKYEVFEDNDIYSTDGDSALSGRTQKTDKMMKEQTGYLDNESSPDIGKSPKKVKHKNTYRNDDYAHDKIKNHDTEDRGGRARKYSQNESVETDDQIERSADNVKGREKRGKTRRGKEMMNEGKDMSDDQRYYERKRPNGPGDRRKRSSFTAIHETTGQRREEEGKENDAPKDSVMNGDHKPSDAPAKMQRPTSAKGSRRRMEDGDLSDDEDVPAGRLDTGTAGNEEPPQPAGRLARPSSARPAPPKRKDDTVQQEPAMRLGSGRPQNLILDDGKDSDEDETFVVEDSGPPSPKHEQPAPMAGDDDDDEDHGGLVKKIMETRKEYEQPRENKIERPTISDAQRRKQREAVQKEIDKLRGSIQTLTRSANPLGKIMDYVQEDLDSMQKELEKWKAENKEHALALKREKAITERAVEPLKVQLAEVDQAIKDQLDLIGAVKSNIIRNDQKIEKMLRTIAKS